jgi:hypothetical protein
MFCRPSAVPIEERSTEHAQPLLNPNTHNLGAIDTAIATAARRAAAWRQDLAGFSNDGVEIAELEKVFPG